MLEVTSPRIQILAEIFVAEAPKVPENVVFPFPRVALSVIKEHRKPLGIAKPGQGECGRETYSPIGISRNDLLVVE